MAPECWISKSALDYFADPGLEAGALLPSGGGSGKCCSPAHRLHSGCPDLFLLVPKESYGGVLLGLGSVKLSLLYVCKQQWGKKKPVVSWRDGSG